MALVLARMIKLKLKEAGIGVPTLSKHTGVPRQTIGNWVSGQRPQNIEHVKAVADYFDLSIDELCFGKTAGALKRSSASLETHLEEIEAGVFEVVLRRVKK